MGNNSPGKMRRQGREAFVEGHDPEVECPAYLSKIHNSYQKQNWIDGWDEAKKDCEAENEELHISIMEEIEYLQKSSSISELVKLLIDRGILTWSSNLTKGSLT
jgi:ribosome modulation factor